MGKLDPKVVERVAIHPRVPSWVREILIDGPDQISEPDGINIETQVVDRSYLEFLEEQIRIGARGPDWSTVLRARVNAMSPLIDQPIMRVSVARGSNYFVAYLRPSDLEVIHHEDDS